MNLSRRGLLLSAGASLLTAPSIVKATSLDFIPRERLHPGWVLHGNHRWTFDDQIVVGQRVAIPPGARSVKIRRTTFARGGMICSWEKRHRKPRALIDFNEETHCAISSSVLVADGDWPTGVIARGGAAS